ncbi:VanW family protein [Peribacillus sp. SCS-155]|uniref:VanW family protein n=1 Tax=Peribacillus sedimenti TaxID=3115297 RepID=UPI0039069AC9
MKKNIALIGLFLMLGVLVFLGLQEGVALGSSNDSTQVITKHITKDITVANKQFAEPVLTLVDSRNGTVIRKVKQSLLSDNQAVQTIAKQLEVKFDRPMIPMRKKDSRIEPGQSRVVLDSKELVHRLTGATAFQREIDVPIKETKQNVHKNDLSNIGRSVLASYTTSFNGSVVGRSKNIELSARAIDGVILGPGDRFSYNLIVGERSVERGYQKANEIVNKQLVEGIGGGICQTSSTLYNAVERSGLEITELHHHSKPVGYVPIGRDATVSYGGYDFKFTNNKRFPVMINTVYQHGSIQVQITTAPQYVANK